MILENVPQNEKLTLLPDYYIQQLMENQNVPIEMWNISKHRQRTNNAVEGWNSKLNSTIGKQKLNVCLQLQKLKEAVSILATEIKGTVKPGQTRRKTYVKQDEIMK